jgi:hypothetical protein
MGGRAHSWELQRVRPVFDAYADGLARIVEMGLRLLLACLT